MTKLTVTFCNFANMLKNTWFCLYMILMVTDIT
jgi:hypothetical protein